MKRSIILVLVLAAVSGFAMAAGGRAPSVAVFPQTGHSSFVFSVAFSPDGRYILTGADHTLKLWDEATGREIRIFSGHSGLVVSVAFSPNGTQALSGSGDDSLKLWDIATGREIKTFLGHSRGVNSVAFSPDGRQALSGSGDNTLKLWDVATGREIRTFSGHSRPVKSVVFSPDGRQALSGSDDNTLKLWDIATGREVRTFSGHSNWVNSVAFSPDGRQALSGSHDYTLKLWDVTTGREVRTFSGHSVPERIIAYDVGNKPIVGVNSVAFSPDGRQALSGAYDKTLKLWDIATGREIRTFSGHSDTVRSVMFSPDGKTIASGSWDRTIKLWDTVTGSEIRTFSGYSEVVRSVAISPDGRQALSGSEDNTLKLWDIATGREVRTFSGHSNWVDSVAFSPDGKQALSGSDDSTLRLWDIATGHEIRTFSGHSLGVNTAAFSPDGKTIASGAWDSTIKLWDTATGREIRTFPFSISDFEVANSIAFSPDGRQLLSGSRSWIGSSINSLKLWDIAIGREIRTFSGYSNWVNTVAFSPDGRQALSGSGGDNLKLWDVATGREIRTFSGHSIPIYSVAFSPDGRQVLSGSDDYTLKLWDAATGREIRTFAGHSGSVNSVAFSPDGRQIISGSQDGTTRLWDTASGSEIAQFIGFTDGEWIVITPDGYYNASADGDKYINVRVGNEVFGIDQYRATFYNPEVVTARITAPPASGQQGGERPIANIQNAYSLQPPSIVVNSPALGSTITSNTVNLSIDVLDNNRSVTSLRVLVNGNLYLKTEPNYRDLRWEGTLRPTQAGENIIEVITSNGASESRQKTTFTWRPSSPPAPRKPDLYILSIGVNQYDNISSLDFCANDARGIIDAFKAQEGKQYNRVYTRLLTDGESILPTAANIRNNLQFLNQGTPDDYYILFFSGHGGDDGYGGFFFCPRDYPFSRINSDEILSVLDLPGKRMVFIDSCHSGGVVGGLAIDNDKLARVLKESNAVVFTASRGVEYSLELGRLQHGAFAYSIIKSLTEGRSGTVSMFDFASEIQRETISVTNNAQHPTLSALSFEDFPIAVRGSSTTSTTPPRQTSQPTATNPAPSWTPPPSTPPTPQQVVGNAIGGAVSGAIGGTIGEAVGGFVSWGIQQLFRR